jgi:GntR family transcriptional regulator / MocR family aminotransferase
VTVDLHVSVEGRGDRTARIYSDIREAVLDGRLATGDRLPPTRELARRLAVSRGTVTAAYERLVAEGFLDSRRGSGTFVSRAVESRPRTPRRVRGGAVTPRSTWRTGGGRDDHAAPSGTGLMPRSAGRSAYDLSVGVPDEALFPLATWRRLVSTELRPGRLRPMTYEGPGHPLLQEQVARHVGLSRSVRASADDVLLTTGAQQALDLAARVLVEPGDLVAVEDPGYTAAHRLFASHGARVTGVPVDDEGLVVDALPARARLVYVTPSHQFPTGVVMSLARRTALLDWAARHDAVVVEDDYDSEFRFEDRPLEPLQSLDRDGRVVYVGTFSKTLLPLLRVGYAIAPASLQGSLREAKRVSDWTGDVITQGALARLMAEGLLSSHLRRASRTYGERRQTLLGALDEHLAAELEILPSVAGLHVCTRFRDSRVADLAVVEAAAAVGVRVEALSPRFLDQPPRPGLVLGFGCVTVDHIPEAVRRVRGAVHSVCDPD